MSKHLRELESRSIFIIREAFANIDSLCLLWSIGKDSNALIHLVRKSFFGKVPFPVVQLDTEMELPEVYSFRDELTHDWNMNLLVEKCPPEEEMDMSLPPATRSATRKTAGLRNLISKNKFKGIFVGIRRDEQATRAKERVFSPRMHEGDWNFKEQPPEIWDQYKTEVPDGAHVRIHPLLHWTELDIWEYTKLESLPVVPLYFSRNGMRYRSLGEKNITFPFSSKASNIDEIIAELKQTKTPERSGRAMDHESENAFEILRVGGYM